MGVRVVNPRSVLGIVKREAKFLGAVLGFTFTLGCILGAAWGVLTYKEEKA